MYVNTILCVRARVCSPHVALVRHIKWCMCVCACTRRAWLRRAILILITLACLVCMLYGFSPWRDDGVCVCVWVGVLRHVRITPSDERAGERATATERKRERGRAGESRVCIMLLSARARQAPAVDVSNYVRYEYWPDDSLFNMFDMPHTNTCVTLLARGVRDTECVVNQHIMCALSAWTLIIFIHHWIFFDTYTMWLQSFKVGERIL